MKRTHAVRCAAAGALAIALAASCAAGTNPIDATNTESSGVCTNGALRCDGLKYERCAGGAWTTEALCTVGQTCTADRGCQACDGGDCLCAPAERKCDGQDVYVCSQDSAWQKVDSCAPEAGTVCVEGGCVDLCAQAAAARSYIGCEYFPAVTINDNACGDFAVVVSNPQSVPADIVVDRSGMQVATAKVAAGAVATIKLSYITELSAVAQWGTEHSVFLEGGAYHLVSTVPVTAYQFNPLEYEQPDCGTIYSFSNDASLLLPKAALTGTYRVVAWPTERQIDSVTPNVIGTGHGFFTVVGTADGTQVKITFSGDAFGVSKGQNLPIGEPIHAGDVVTFPIDRGDVLQFLSPYNEGQCETIEGPNGPTFDACIGDRSSDLTGTLVEADHPVAVIGGNECAFVPFDKWACDHLEESMLPLETWGQNALVVATAPQVADEPNVARVVSGTDNNAIAFDPPVHAPVTLNAGDFIEFPFQGAFQAKASGRVAIAQFMVGEDYDGFGQPPVVGDPSMGFGIPAEEFRTSYDFLTPDTYTLSYVLVIAPTTASIELDGTAVTGLTPIASTGYGFARVEVQPGAHHIADPKGTTAFGIIVSGLASYTSYLYPGGLDLHPVPIPK